MGEHKTNPNARANDQARNTWIQPAPRPTCGDCEYAGLIPADLNAIECQGLPPQILLIPSRMANGQPGVTPQLTRPNLPRRQPCCALFLAKELRQPAPLEGLPGLMGVANETRVGKATLFAKP